jgi:hypothetical protein
MMKTHSVCVHMLSQDCASHSGSAATIFTATHAAAAATAIHLKVAYTSAP